MNGKRRRTTVVVEEAAEHQFFRVSLKQLTELRDAVLEAGRLEVKAPESPDHFNAVEREGLAFRSCIKDRIK